MRATLHRRYWFWLILAAGVTTGGVLWIESLEPRYLGVPASQYALQTLSTPRLTNVDIADRLRPMGTNVAVAALVKVAERDLSRRRQWWQSTYVNWYRTCPPSVRAHLPAPKFGSRGFHMTLYALAEFGPAAERALPLALRAYQQRNDGMLKSAALELIAAIGPRAQSALPVLLGDAAATNEYHRWRVVEALPRIDPSGNLCATAIVSLLSDRDLSVAHAAVQSISKMARQSPHLSTNLWIALRRPESRVCEIAAFELKEHGALSWNGIEPFLRQLDSPTASERVTAATVLAHGGKFAVAVVPALRRSARDLDEKVREAALASLAGLAWEPSVVRTCRLDAAREVLRHGAENRAGPTLNMVPHFFPDSAALVPLLMTALEHPSSRVRGKAAEALGNLGPAATEAVPALLKSTGDEWLTVREAATNALRRIKPERH